MTGMSEIVQAAKDISSVIGCVTGVAAFAVALVRPLRRKITSFIKSSAHATELEENIAQVSGKLTEIEKKLDYMDGRSELNAAGIKVCLGNSIKHIYLKYRVDKQIPLLEKEALIQLHEAYRGLHGNSIFEEMYDEAMGWEVI